MRLTLLIVGLGAIVIAPANAQEPRPGGINDIIGILSAPVGPREWSGEPGASGHPLMTREAILQAASEFRACLDRLWPEAAKRGVKRPTFDLHVAGLMPELRIMDLMDAQPEFSKSVWDYLDLLVTEERIHMGREMLTRHGPIFDAAERAYGVDRHVIAAIWGIESKYSTMAGDRPVLRSTATLACIGRRQDFFRDEFIATLEILERGDINADALKGSWAGAFGATQFMPSAFKRSAIDFDGDGRRDIIGSVPDIVASTSNLLKKGGWKPGQNWGFEVVLPQGFDFLLADRARQFTPAQWERMGIRRAGAEPMPRTDDKAYLFVPAGARGPAFLMLNNFRAILSYNPAEAYALAIGHLSDRMRGGPGFVQAWPRDEKVLSRSERLELQQRLVGRGFDIGEPDGRLGAKTRDALRRFQASIGLVPDGFASASLLERLRSR